MYVEFTLAMKNPEAADIVHDRVVAGGLDVNAHTVTVLGSEFPCIAYCHGELSDDDSQTDFINRVTDGVEYSKIED